MIRIADRCVRALDAAHWLLYEYNDATVRFYDCAGTTQPVRSSAENVELEDLGRLVCVGASLTYRRGQVLLDRAGDAPWPAADLPSLKRVTETGDDFYRHPAVGALWRLFDFWCQHDGLKFGTVSKLLHIKWPTFVPIADDSFRSVYQQRAVAEHNASDLIRQELGDSGPRKSTANIRAYWYAFRNDLVAAEDDLENLRHRLRELTVTGDRTLHRDRLLRLSDLRLLDALAWGLDDNGLPAAVG